VLPAAELAAAAPVSETNKLPPIAKPAALVDIDDTIKPIQVKTIKAKLTQIQTTDLGPVVVRVREEPTEPAAVEAPPTAARKPENVRAEARGWRHDRSGGQSSFSGAARAAWVVHACGVERRASTGLANSADSIRGAVRAAVGEDQ
jgi:hypothetical protein